VFGDVVLAPLGGHAPHERPVGEDVVRLRGGVAPDVRDARAHVRLHGVPQVQLEGLGERFHHDGIHVVRGVVKVLANVRQVFGR